MTYKCFQSTAFKRSLGFLLIAAIFSLLNGCEENKGPTYPKPDTKLITDKSVVFNDPAKLATPFSFSKTMDQIVATAGGIPTNSVSMLQSIIDSFAQTAFVHPVSGKTIAVKARPGESSILPKDLLNPDSPDGMIPVGLFNRFDLAPADGSNCGEYRIVYTKKSSGPTDRLTMIFEARIPNPDPGKGLAGCAAITDFWVQRSSDTDATQTVAELEKFYYQGIPGVAPVIKAENYGMPLGQLRVNLFKTPDPQEILWSLREFLVNFDQSGQAIFKPEPVDDSPMAFLFRAAAELPDGFDETDQHDFRNSFLGQPLCNLVNPDRINNTASAKDIINGISAGFDTRFNDFESISQDDEDNPADRIDPLLLDQVQSRLAELKDLTGISSVQLMNRAGTMTCGGCHQFSAGKDLGSGAVWPNSLRFVHVDETGKLSPLLTDVFIPKRVQIAQQFKENRAPFQQKAAECPGVIPAARSVESSSVKKAREHEVYKNVDAMRDQIQKIVQAPDTQAEKSEKLQAILPTLEEATGQARKLESGMRGAYTPARTH
ncbi:hypothetical protein [Nitrosomonas ureae]|uniref:Cytochrome c domain-containing protein n=1 Tax=Nitrosomonas ureae TaxID=44577 RepID=A0A1H2GKC6_9PROT|nr:hypothetical protein [Nitrosomonas ureae]ALQ51548.1 hypothetical protein ATY38_10175 [Nitrosomonas ureae]SDU19909.1 hypothetical protein SAMN05216406_13319 [Nitrosomonas ureae]